MTDGFMSPSVDLGEPSPGLALGISPAGSHASPDAGRHCDPFFKGVPVASLNHQVSPLLISAGSHVCLANSPRRIDTVGNSPGGRNGNCPGGRRCTTEKAEVLL